jgi:E3 ubiquitin-protein ligase SIAH1
MEYMRPPITFCVNGHNICNICKPKIRDCPTCRQPFSDIRNLALEMLARDMKYPCTYRKYGCKEMFAHDKIGDHQEKCRYSPQICPVAKLDLASCSWTGNYSDIKGHMKDKHSERCCEYIEGQVRDLEDVGTAKWYVRFLFAYNEVFYRSFHLKGDVFYALLQYIGPAENAAKYRYKVEFVNKDKTEGITAMHLARSVAENLDDIFKSGNCGKLHCDVVTRFKKEDGIVNFTMEILKVRD